MSVLIKGQISNDWLDQEINKDEFVRDESIFRNWVTRDGKAGISGDSGFKAEAGRYHLYISHACPWAHRTIIVRKLKQLEDFIGVSVVAPEMFDKGWSFTSQESEVKDHLYAYDYLYQLYTHADPVCTSQVTVPVLWDKKNETIVNNESSEIIRMFNSEFNDLTANDVDLYPENLRSEIDHVNEFIYENINNGVYRCGFARSQIAYEESFERLFGALDELEVKLSCQRYLVGDKATEADWRLFTSLIRFDVVYYGHFKCNLRRIIDYPNLFKYMKRLYLVEGISQTVNFGHIKSHYYFSHVSINPTQIVPAGPEIKLFDVNN
ncbi:MAG: glutathione S-transferase family protein [Gammaproteobacteria bacterium]|nr:glutathione S-transferase family protein [Gammaproteobacteria bacterium]